MKLRNVLAKSLVALLPATACVYAGDYLSLRFRIPNHREQFSVVQVQPYYAIAEKNHKTEFMPADAVSVMCAHSLFPHFGANPCWYVTRHTDQRIDE